MQDKCISAISNIYLDRATYNDVSLEDLSYVNFFYGGNGTGKTSIARAIQEDEGVAWLVGKTYSDYDVLIFNQDFIRENFADCGDIKGVYTFGKDDILAKKKIALLIEEKKYKTEQLNESRAKYAQGQDRYNTLRNAFLDLCFRKTADVRKYFSECMKGKKQKKGMAEAILGVNNPFNHDIKELKRLYDTAYDNSARMYPEFKCSSELTYDRLPGNDIMARAVVCSNDTAFSGFLKALGSAAADWVHDGHAHYLSAADGKCPFCQQKLPENFEAQIAACFDTQYENELSTLKYFREVYLRKTELLINILNANLNDVMPSVDIQLYTEKLASLKHCLEINRQRIEEKLRTPSQILSLIEIDAFLHEMNILIGSINQQIQENNDIVLQKQNSRNRCSKEIMQYIAYILQNDVRQYRNGKAEILSDLSRIKANGEQLNREISSLTSEISELNRRNANTEAAIDNINQLLEKAGFQGFRIHGIGDTANSYEIVREDGTVAEDLSDGERSFLAFLYFDQQVRGSMSSEQLKNKIVVIDDPVSNMDRTSMLLVCDMIREMINICRNNTEYPKSNVSGDFIKQIFILSHDFYFQREITKGQTANDSCTSFYVLTKSNNVSAVTRCTRFEMGFSADNGAVNQERDSYAAIWEEIKDIKSAASTDHSVRV